MIDKLEKASSIILTIAALLIAGVLVRREFFTPATVSAAGTDTKPRLLKNWESLVPHGRLVGDSTARVRIIEFSDLECPFCRRFDSTFRVVQQQYPHDVALVFMHLPLSFHRNARPAARAAECAHQTGHFGQFIKAIYAKQESLGVKSWASYARDAAIPDTAGFARCTRDTVSAPMIARGVAVAESLQISATPTIIVNGWLLSHVPSDTELVRVRNDVIKGRKPYQ